MKCYACGGGNFDGGVNVPAGAGIGSKRSSETYSLKSRSCIRIRRFVLRSNTPICGPTSEVRTVCVSSASTDLCGGCWVNQHPYRDPPGFCPAWTSPSFKPHAGCRGGTFENRRLSAKLPFRQDTKSEERCQT